MNLYKMKYLPCFEDLGFNNRGMKKISKFELSMYIKEYEKERKLNWKWVADAFEENLDSAVNNPNCIVTIKNIESELVYCLSFGTSHFNISKGADHNYPKELLRRFDINKINNAGLTNPGSENYKNIQIFRGATDKILNTSSGVEKVKLTINGYEDFGFTSKTLEIGNSIKFQCEENFDSICNVIINLENLLLTEPIRKVSEYTYIDDEERISELENEVAQNKSDNISLLVDDASLYGVYYGFQDDFKVQLFDGKNELTQKISFNAELILEKIDLSRSNKQQLKFFDNDVIKYSKKIQELLYVEIDRLNVIKVNGKWYEFNEDFINFVNDKLNDEGIIHKQIFDYDLNQIEKFVEISSYKELDYNKYISKILDDSLLLDRVDYQIGDLKIELCDIYDIKNKECISVKFGKASADLIYNIRQSYNTMDYLIQNNSSFTYENELYKVENVALLFIFEKKKPYLEEDGKVKIEDCKMFGLKRELVIWAEKVRIERFTPKIYFAYKYTQ
jgi:uncharacterized protein (TIGR04141 family)